MKFTIDKDLIINEFQSLAAVADKKQTLPILSNILIRCEEDKVKLLSTDLEVELEVVIKGENIESAGETTIPAKKAADISGVQPSII
jgi:DNA polymerase sliding clamp subunit (PCNA homolog)